MPRIIGSVITAKEDEIEVRGFIIIICLDQGLGLGLCVCVARITASWLGMFQFRVVYLV